MFIRLSCWAYLQGSLISEGKGSYEVQEIFNKKKMKNSNFASFIAREILYLETI